MTSTTLSGGLPRRIIDRDRDRFKRQVPAGVTLVAFIAMLVVCGAMQPVIFSATGLNLALSSIVPLVIAALAQMVMMSIGDIDLGIGNFIGLVTAVAATSLSGAPLVHLRKVPALIATLGASFVWYGLGLFVLPIPGGDAPRWLITFAAWTPSTFPVPVIPILVVTAATWFTMQQTPFGARIRALGSNPAVLDRSGGSSLRTRVVTYMVVAVLAILAGLSLSSQIGGGDVTSANDYTLISVAAVILGGGSFFGGHAVAWGAMVGAVTLGLVSVLLSLLDLSSNVQPAVEGGIVIAALAGRLLVEKVLT